MTITAATTFGGVELLSANGHEDIAVIRLHQGGRPVVVLDEALIRDLDSALDALASAASGVAGAVLTSGSPRVFVAGADLKGIRAWDDAALHSYLEMGARVFGRLATLPFPTAAAINGAALGGGLELAMHCDGLIAAPGAKPYPVGLPEAALGLCPGWGGTNLLPARIAPAGAIESTAAGSTMMFADAVDAGLFDAVCDQPESLVPAAISWIRARPAPNRDGAPLRWIGREPTRDAVGEALTAGADQISRTAMGAAVGDAVRAGLDHGWPEALQVERDRLVSLRHTEHAAAALDAFLNKSAPKPSPKAGETTTGND